MTATEDHLARLARLTTSDLGDGMDRMGVVHSAIRPLWRGVHCQGRALTVWTRAGDNLMVRAALDLIAPGDVLVVNGQGDETRALLGDRMVGKAASHGAVGVVVDGAVRDVEALQELGVPVFARAVTPAGPYKHGPGQLNVPVAIGGVVVRPGDIVCGDSDGVVVVPPEQLVSILERAETFAALEPLH